MIKGQREYERFKKGEKLTHRQSILAQCFVCNGMGEGGEDCKGVRCPLYQYMPYRKDRVKKVLSEERRQKQIEILKRVRESKNKAFPSVRL